MKNSAYERHKATGVREEKCLILTLKAGSGHLQAAHAKQKELSESQPGLKVQTVDVMNGWLGNAAGDFFVKKWNRAQCTGNLVTLEIYTLTQFIADAILWLPLFFCALYAFSSKKITRIIDTQNMGISPILKAIRLVQFLTGRKIDYEKIVTDLPTSRANHFFRPIRWLSKKDRKLVTLVTTKPLLEKFTDEDSFWLRSCKLNTESIRYEDLPLRPSFNQYKELDPTKELKLNFQINAPYETQYIEKALSYGKLESKRTESNVEVTIKPEDKVSILMLGANPHTDAILDYIRHFIKIVKEKKFVKRKDVLFVFCNEMPNKNSTMMKRILEIIETTSDYPNSLTIVPMSYQNDTVVAPLYHRSNATFTRSGGLTSMEILAACKGHVWIHKGSPPKFLPRVFLNFPTIKGGMPPWERGNAEYLRAKKGARFITPQTFSSVCASYFEE